MFAGFRVSTPRTVILSDLTKASGTDLFRLMLSRRTDLSKLARSSTAIEPVAYFDFTNVERHGWSILGGTGRCRQNAQIACTRSQLNKRVMGRPVIRSTAITSENDVFDAFSSESSFVCHGATAPKFRVVRVLR